MCKSSMLFLHVPSKEIVPSLSPILFILAVLVTIAWQVGWNLAHLLNFCGNF